MTSDNHQQIRSPLNLLVENFVRIQHLTRKSPVKQTSVPLSSYIYLHVANILHTRSSRWCPTARQAAQQSPHTSPEQTSPLHKDFLTSLSSSRALLKPVSLTYHTHTLASLPTIALRHLAGSWTESLQPIAGHQYNMSTIWLVIVNNLLTHHTHLGAGQSSAETWLECMY